MANSCECGRSMAVKCETAHGPKCLICAVERIEHGWSDTVLLYSKQPVLVTSEAKGTSHE